MKTVELKTVDGRVRYYLADDTGAPVQPVLKYLKFKDNVGYARNTLRMHCIHLKHFFTYLGEAGKDFEQVNIDDLAGFLAWLKNPDILKKVVPLRFEPEHQPQTINAMIDTMVMFYDYLLRHEGMENQLSEKMVKFVRDPGRNYRSFLHGIAENRMIKLPCRQQMGHCLNCANFCTARDNIPEYEKEIEKVKEQLKISKMLGRDEWEEKNQNYREILEKMLARIQKEGLIHKNGSHREECDG